MLGCRGAWASAVRIVVRAGSSVEEGRSGTRERMGYIVVVVVVVDDDGDDCCVDGAGLGVFSGLSRCARCCAAAFRYFAGSSRGLGAAFVVGHAMLYPPAPSASLGWISKLSAATPS